MASSEPRWDDAKCAGDQVNGYFPERGTAQITARDAKAICNGEDNTGAVCPAKAKCLEYALERKERFGIWGGMSERERAKVAKERRVAARVQELEIEQNKQVRAAAARKGWENRRQRDVQQQAEQAAKVVAIKTKKTRHRATQEAPARRTRSAQ